LLVDIKIEELAESGSSAANIVVSASDQIEKP
jgi:hypothetical protein